MMFTTPKMACEILDEARQRPAALTQEGQCEAEQDGDQQDLQDLAFGERVHEGVRDDVHQEVHGRQRLGLVRVLRDRVGVEVGRVDVETGARFDQVGDDQADRQREGRYDLEVDQGLAADEADLFHVLHAGDARDDGTKDHRGDDHLDQFDEAVSQRLHRGGDARIIYAQQDTENNRDQYLDIQDFIDGPFHDAPPIRN